MIQNQIKERPGKKIALEGLSALGYEIHEEIQEELPIMLK